jgi:hypothetical protein
MIMKQGFFHAFTFAIVAFYHTSPTLASYHYLPALCVVVSDGAVSESHSLAFTPTAETVTAWYGYGIPDWNCCRG